jgi:hypothetical protein
MAYAQIMKPGKEPTFVLVEHLPHWTENGWTPVAPVTPKARNTRTPLNSVAPTGDENPASPAGDDK